jgi:hypothetical protein
LFFVSKWIQIGLRAVFFTSPLDDCRTRFVGAFFGSADTSSSKKELWLNICFVVVLRKTKQIGNVNPRIFVDHNFLSVYIIV